MKVRLLGVAAVVLLLTGCAAQTADADIPETATRTVEEKAIPASEGPAEKPAEPANPDDEKFAGLQESLPTVADMPADEFMKLAERVCDRIAAGEDPTTITVIPNYDEADELSWSDNKSVVATAGSLYCPAS